MTKAQIRDKMAEIETTGKAIGNRIRKLESDRDFLVDSLITRPTANMTAQRELLDAWSDEIEELQKDQAYLRKEWLRYNDLLTTKKEKRL